MMTSETQVFKTNEFLRRRRLRLQQVRDQSKDIAKKIRQRANSENLRQVSDLDAKKQKEYFECQENLVKRLEDLYAKGLNHLGTGHHNASELKLEGLKLNKADISKLRGKEAAAILQKKRQEKLDEQKKLLDRKLQAREAANEISREKSSVLANKIIAKTQKTASTTEIVKDIKESENNSEPVLITKNNIGTQWHEQTIPDGSESAVPALSSLADDQGTLKQSEPEANKSEKNTRKDLFAISKEMPSDLCGAQMDTPEIRNKMKPSLTLVSEYLQSRKLRLRETEATSKVKKHSNDISSLKQTILQTRSSKAEAPGKGSTCTEKSIPHSVPKTKSSVIMYNHCTRDTRDLPQGDEQLIERVLQTEEDAYTQAIKEVFTTQNVDKEHQKKIQDMRNKVAVTKQAVEKEYRDTIKFLNSLPKDKSSNVIKTAYMDERQQQMLKDKRQLRMQQEYKKLEKECRKHQSCADKVRNKSKSPSNHAEFDSFDSRDYQYSWMPVPESDGNLAIHTIPNAVKDGKNSNSVKFSKVDSYHEYRSRHKHTPPTKDTGSHETRPSKKRVKTVIVDKNDSTEESTVISESNSVEDLQLTQEQKVKKDDKLDSNSSDAERIIIYKILDTKSNKHFKEKNKLLSDIAKSLTSIEKVQKSTIEENRCETSRKIGKNLGEQSVDKAAPETVVLGQVNEGLYKAEEKGDNVYSMYYRTDNNVTAVAEEASKMCQHKNLSADQTRDRGTFVQWQDGDVQDATSTSKLDHCTVAALKEKRDDLKVRKSVPVHTSPTAATSASSFKTTTNDKASSAIGEGGFIKLLDEGGHEAGTFFLTGTNFLKSNAYEVVIQLKKKDGANEGNDKSTREKTPNQTVSENKSPEDIKLSSVEGLAKSNDIVQIFQEPEDSEMHEVLEFRSHSEKESVRISPQISEQPYNTQTAMRKNAIVQTSTSQINLGCESSIDICLVKSCKEKKDVADKGTSFRQDFSGTQFDPPSRPATTTYTQTTNSPIHRPVYLHMSSSTSTAYMSPPEIILPKSLRHDFDLPIIKKFDIRAKHNSDKCLKKIRYPKKTLNKKKLKLNIYENNRDQVTPPNTAKSYVKHQYDSSDEQPHQHDMKSHRITRIDKKKCKYHNCAANLPYIDNLKRQLHRNHNAAAETYRQAQKHFLGKNPGQKPKPKTKTSRSILTHSSESLNPIIKDYINKLLSLNRQGLKALEVAEQECSSVATPCSSIINVPYNVNTRNLDMDSKISLEHIKKMLMQQVIAEHLKNNNAGNKTETDTTLSKKLYGKPRRKTLHKVKSLNISRNLLQKRAHKLASLSTLTNDDIKTFENINIGNLKRRSCSSPTPRESYSGKSLSTSKDHDIEDSGHIFNKHKTKYPLHKATVTDTSAELPKESHDNYRNKTDIPVNVPTQTIQNIDSDIMKLAEDKLNNMEKIADLTEKCTKRLSSLARVLEEVRKNKSLVYNQISGSDSADSQSDYKTEKLITSPKDVLNSLEIKSPEILPLETKSSETLNLENNPTESNSENKTAPVNDDDTTHAEFISFLTDIPKPNMFRLTKSENKPQILEPISAVSTNADQNLASPNGLSKCRPKPPPALSRVHLKHGEEILVPHELSTVLEVDSPMSIKNKNQSFRCDIQNTSNKSTKIKETQKVNERNETMDDLNGDYNPDLLQGNKEFSKHLKLSSNELSDDPKFQMIDLEHFNEIMLEPFITIHEYAKKYNIAAPDEESNIEDRHKNDAISDDISSLRSDGSLPDVIAELLKRNVITEPFKFETASNINSATMSSESALSMLALSKARKNKKKSMVIQNKENIGETTDSISSNPDLENAFKKLGMGWASSTLKKTKECLAFSSSSNTSSSSLSQYKIKSYNQDVPALITDSVSSVSKNGSHSKHLVETSKNARLQTSFTNSMTVKEFLANELANKITFTSNKFGMDDTEEEFVSLFETKMPEGFKQQSQVNCDKFSNESIPSGVNRARTSTPVQLFKSTTYHSSSCSNISNELFSNADLSSVKMTSNSLKNHSTSDKDDLTIPNYSLKTKKNSDCSKSD